MLNELDDAYRESVGLNVSDTQPLNVFAYYCYAGPRKRPLIAINGELDWVSLQIEQDVLATAVGYPQPAAFDAACEMPIKAQPQGASPESSGDDARANLAGVWE